MQTKTIKKVITNKLNEWLESIDDADLRKQVRENILLSGGSITAMFLNIPVNDYDIYIKDMSVLVRLAKYYFGRDVLDGRQREQYIEDYKRDNGYEEDEDFSADFLRIRSLKPDQVKLNIPSNGIKYTPDENKKYQLSFASQNAISLTDDIQIVLRFHGDSEQIHKTFDFIHATNYFTFSEGLVTNVKALECVLTKELKYQGSLYPLTSIIRMKKFINRGWKINAGEILKIMFQISELDLRNPVILEEQLIGVDVAYFSVLIECLRGVKKETMTSAYINTLIDKVFNAHEDDEDEIKPQ